MNALDERTTAVAKTKTRPAPEPEVDEDEDLELEDLDEDVEEEDAPKKKKSTAQEVTFGVADLAKYLDKKVPKDKPYTTRELRTLIRKMAREDNPRVDREIVEGNRTRYDWPEGPKDPEVKRIIAAVAGGEVEQGKKEALNKLKESQAKKKAAKDKKGKKQKPKPAPVVDEDDDFEEIEDEDDTE